MEIAVGVQILSLAGWLLVIKFLQLSLWPALVPAFGRYAYGAAYPSSILLLLAGSWYCGLTGLPVHLALAPFVLLFLASLRQGRYTRSGILPHGVYDVIFFACFFFMLEVRFITPLIAHFSEQFMDHAFLASIMRVPVVPPLDPWFAGEPLSVYYYGGHWLFATLALITDSPSYVAFNLAPGTVLGLAAVSLYTAGDLLLERFKWLPAAVLLLGNPAFYWHILHGENISWAFQYSQAIIPFTKNEYPLFTLFLGDVHAHLFGMFNQAFLIFLLIFAYTKWESLEDRGQWIVIGMTTLSLGSMPLINMWNVFTYAPLTLLCGVLCWRKHRSLGSAGRDPRIYILLVPVLSVALYLPYYVQMGADTLRGIGIVSTPTDPFQFLQMFGFFIAVLVVYIARDLIQRPYLLFIPLLLWIAGHGTVAVIAVPLMGLIARRGQTAAEMIAIWGLVVVAVCEVVYLKDVYINEYYRFNTVFKLFFDGWILMGTASLLLVGAWLARHRFFDGASTAAYRSAAVLMVAAFLIVPWAADVDFGRDVLRIGFDSGYHTLDGSAYLEGAHPGDAAALRFLASAPQNTRIAEAVKGDYTYFSRVSSFTGIPTILGQPTHEYHWRGNEGNWYTTRRDDIKILYEVPNQTMAIMEKYGITHIYVGELEHSLYNVSLPVSDLEPVYHESGVVIYRRKAV